MDKQEKKRYFRLIYRSAFGYLGALLVVSLLLGQLLGGGYYTVSALCAAGFVMIAWGWFTYLKMTGMRPFPGLFPKKKTRVPQYHRKDTRTRPHRPAFLRDNEDFDDDLTSQTAVAQEDFTPLQAAAARAAARAACGILLVLISFLIPI